MHLAKRRRQPDGLEHEVERVLTKVFPAKWLRAKARETGAVKRVRGIDMVAFFWTMVLGFGVNSQRAIASLHRKYEEDAGEVAYSSFYDRFTPDLVRFLRECALHGLEQLAKTAPRPLKESLHRFKDIVIQDSTVVRLHEALAKKWPATRSRKVAAGVKVSIVISVIMNNVKTVRLFGERVSEAKTLRIGPWVRDRILLLDLGFFKYQAFDRIQRNGGYFISRLKDNADPLVTRLVRTVRGRSVPVEGERLRSVLPRLKREVLDAMIEVNFRHRSYAGKTSGDIGVFRVVAVLNHESGKHHVYVTNIPPDVLAAEDIAALYGARWEVELVFKELKSSYALDELGLTNANAVQAMIWTAILTLTVSRALHRAIATYAGEEEYTRFTSRRWSRIFREQAPGILADVLRYEHVPYDARTRFAFMSLVGKDPNRNRERLLDQVRE